MNTEQFQLLQATPLRTTEVVGDMLVNRTPRTLVHGVSSGYDIFHIYLTESHELQRVVYSQQNNLVSQTSGVLALDYCVPAKYMISENCDFEFCALLKSLGADLNFQGTPKSVPANRFTGKKLEELYCIPEEHLQSRPPILLLEELELPAVNVQQLGLRARTQLEGRLDDTMRGYLNGALASILLPRENSATAEKWLQNMLTFLSKDVTEYIGHYSMPETVNELILTRCKEALNSHLVTHGYETRQLQA